MHFHVRIAVITATQNRQYKSYASFPEAFFNKQDAQDEEHPEPSKLREYNPINQLSTHEFASINANTKH